MTDSTRPTHRALGIVVVCISVLATLTACASSAAEQQTSSFTFTSASDSLAYAKAHHYRQDIKYLDDGAVSEEEYRAAEQTYQTCLEHQGYVFGPVVVDPVGGLQLIYRDHYQGPRKSYNSRAVNACQNVFDPVEETYTQTNVQRMDPQLLAAVESCLTMHNESYPSGASKIADFVSKKDAQIAPALRACVSSGVKTLYPNLPVIAIAF